jgi:uncharacterized RDD family membrane protein YckC
VSVRTHPSQWVSAQGQYAGSASRFAAYLIDLIASSVLYLLALAIISFVVQIVTGSPVSWHRHDIVVVIIYVAWQFLYFGFQWAADGSTWGMALLGVQVVQANGTRLDPWRGWVRSLTFPLGFLTLGLGFLGIPVQREHRALYDLIAGTAVVYAWDASGPAPVPGPPGRAGRGRGRRAGSGQAGRGHGRWPEPSRSGRLRGRPGCSRRIWPAPRTICHR